MSEPSHESPAPDAPGARLDAAETPPTSPEAAERAEHADAAYARRLRDALGGLGMLGTLAAPHTHNQLLELLVRNAMQVTSARVGTLRLLDRTTNELVFEVIEGVGPAQRELLEAARQVRVPLGQGIAGWVAASGQPVVRSDLAEDARFTAEATQRFGYAPRSMLCLPLQGNEGVLGVIELLDKAGDEPFTARDMNVLGLFGQAAAAAIAQSQVLNDLTRLFGFMLQRLLSDATDAALLQDHAPELVARTVQASDYRDAIQIALTAGQIARQGPDARRLCLRVLDNFADYLRGQHSRATLGGRLS
jgi:putative methionine-R-sulfoxide reductase with GAF domain